MSGGLRCKGSFTTNQRPVGLSGWRSATLELVDAGRMVAPGSGTQHCCWDFHIPHCWGWLIALRRCLYPFRFRYSDLRVTGDKSINITRLRTADCFWVCHLVGTGRLLPDVLTRPDGQVAQSKRKKAVFCCAPVLHHWNPFGLTHEKTASSSRVVQHLTERIIYQMFVVQQHTAEF